MNEKHETLARSPLFRDIAAANKAALLHCLEAKTQTYKKGELVLLSGDPLRHIGFVLSGGVKIIREDAEGNSAIIAELGAAEVFGEAFACAGVDISPISVLSSEDSEVLWINFRKVLGTCRNACSFHSQLIENMLRLIAEKNLLLSQKMDILSKRSTREKLLAFFDAQGAGEKQFAVPFTREEMAQYLCVDRSAMSGELSKMRNEGLIRYKKNAFEILRTSTD